MKIFNLKETKDAPIFTNTLSTCTYVPTHILPWKKLVCCTQKMLFFGANLFMNFVHVKSYKRDV